VELDLDHDHKHRPVGNPKYDDCVGAVFRRRQNGALARFEPDVLMRRDLDTERTNQQFRNQ